MGDDNSEGNQVPISGGMVGDSGWISDGEGRRAETADETVQSQEFETGEIYGRVHREVPVPAVHRSKRANAGVHTNPFHAPRSTCNAVNVSTDMVSQVLTSIGTALFEKALQGCNEIQFNMELFFQLRELVIKYLICSIKALLIFNLRFIL